MLTGNNTDDSAGPVDFGLMCAIILPVGYGLRLVPKNGTEKRNPLMVLKFSINNRYCNYSVREAKMIDQKMKEASDKLDAIRMRAKPVSENELLSWICEGREK